MANIEDERGGLHTHYMCVENVECMAAIVAVDVDVVLVASVGKVCNHNTRLNSVLVCSWKCEEKTRYVNMNNK